jgi:hypothetical protein
VVVPRVSGFGRIGGVVMIHLYDGNNVMLRAIHKPMLGAARPMSLRMRYEHCCSQPAGTQFWCWDGRDHNSRRQEIYPRYKTNREPHGEDVFTQIQLWKDVARHSPAIQITVDGWECDDVVSTLARRFARTGVPVTIHSNDMDYAQLLTLPNVTLNGVNTKGIPGRWVALYKALVGDTSDHIAGIPNFGHKSWEVMEPYWAQIERAIVQGNPAGFVGLPFNKGVAAWLTDQSNIDTLQAMLTVTHFIDVPEDEIVGGMYVGEMSRAEATALLGKFFL